MNFEKGLLSFKTVNFSHNNFTMATWQTLWNFSLIMKSCQNNDKKCFRETLVVWSLFHRQNIKQKSQIHLPSSVLLWTCLATSVLRESKIFKILSCQLYFHTTNYTLKDLFTRHNTFWKSVSSSPVLKATIRDTIQKVKLLLSTPILLQNWKIVALQMNKTKLTISLEDEVTFCVPQNKIIVLWFKCFLSENLAKKMDFCVLFVYIIIDKL